MSAWGDKVRKALQDPAVLNGIAQVAASWMKDHINENAGRGAGGNPEPHRPLKRVTGTYLSASKPKRGVVGRTRMEVETDGKKSMRTFYEVRQIGYRFGGQPLRNTGKLERSLSATASTTTRGLNLSMRGMRYGKWQDRGFSTRGPNYIPLTLKGARQHGTGKNPNNEGLTRGKDFVMAWKGVTVPARPFILPTREDLRTFGKSVFLGLRAVLKGK